MKTYHAFLGIEWEFEFFSTSNVKREIMIFESNRTRVVQPLDPYKGPQYVEPSKGVMWG